MSDHKWVTANLIYLHNYCEQSGLEDVVEVLVETIETIAPILARGSTSDLYTVLGNADQSVQDENVLEFELT